jgi:hypothetical protein
MDITKQTKLTRENGWREGVAIDTEEAHRLKMWLIAHVCPLTMAHTADYEIKQSGASGIGTNTVIRCSCGEGKDVTNYGVW